MKIELGSKQVLLYCDVAGVYAVANERLTLSLDWCCRGCRE